VGCLGDLLVAVPNRLDYKYRANEAVWVALQLNHTKASRGMNSWNGVGAFGRDGQRDRCDDEGPIRDSARARKT
jgi:hypothetical protein